jgi:hypothetical protein
MVVLCAHGGSSTIAFAAGRKAEARKLRNARWLQWIAAVASQPARTGVQQAVISCGFPGEQYATRLSSGQQRVMGLVYPELRGTGHESLGECCSVDRLGGELRAVSVAELSRGGLKLVQRLEVDITAQLFEPERRVLVDGTLARDLSANGPPTEVSLSWIPHPHRVIWRLSGFLEADRLPLQRVTPSGEPLTLTVEDLHGMDPFLDVDGLLGDNPRPHVRPTVDLAANLVFHAIRHLLSERHDLFD